VGKRIEKAAADVAAALFRICAASLLTDAQLDNASATSSNFDHVFGRRRMEIIGPVLAQDSTAVSSLH
jgi:hypothetical protein